MSLLISFFVGIQMLHSVVAPPHFPFLFPSCNSLAVKAAAEEALNKLNAHRTEGYVFSLQSIFDAHEIPEWDGDSLFYLILDVSETECHVLSRKSWKKCRIRHQQESVDGQCEVIIQFNRSSNHSHLYSYVCALQPLPDSVIVLLCPNCPIPGDPSGASFQETAVKTLAKFNAENEHHHYFAIRNVVKASSQWADGPSHFVEYVIQETSCDKNPPVSDITQCPFLPSESAERGLCTGSVVDNETEKNRLVTVKCNLFLPQPPVTDERTPQSTSEHPEPHRPHPSPTITETPPKQKETVGQVIYHHSWSEPAVLEVQEPNPTGSPTLASPEQEATPHTAKPAGPDIPPFPTWFSQSAECPGDSTVYHRDLELSLPPLATTSQTKSDIQN